MTKKRIVLSNEDGPKSQTVIEGGLTLETANQGNLRPEEWANLLLKHVMPEGIGGDIRNWKLSPWCKTLLNLTEKTATFLDLGSGRGEHCALLALRGGDTTLTDWSSENLSFSMKLFEVLGIKGKFLRTDIVDPLPFESNSFDTVFSCGVFEHFTDEEIKRILREAFRVSKKRVIIMVPNALSIAYRIGKWYMEKTKRWSWGREFPFRTLKPYFRAVTKGKVFEFTVDARHSLNFLTMPCGERIKRTVVRALRLRHHSRPALFRQGYLLVTVGEKV
jgi:ubiquinone/menaquinone biosynthesis C-methylase UbiE